ncbi:dihydroorotate dehydrogenase [Atopobium sp. oral taxon 199]|uniref:dihydroorotate dehydrogenase n=1 Tax=Atopobium sp. oral taxon 199 TaxID=712156 RepID=UPI00034E4259|nr:dihydroorotate dehydrogenase [Atopobium sp. oral taxon 199]EPD78144.1 dihydroorotate dehydrogenase (fumarate) [Atopobium sp. oral taxon 199 str. F0494]
MVSAIAMAVDLGGIAMKNPVNTAAGTFGYGWQFEGFYDVSQLGAITMKGVARVPWDGNPAPRMCELTSGMMNSVGLANPGIDAFVDRTGSYMDELEGRGTRVIMQMAAHSVKEMVEVVERTEELAPHISGIELNVSCPNLAKGGRALGATPQQAAEVMRAVRPLTNLPILVKMAPVNVAEIGKALEAEGADGLTLINSLSGMSIDVHTRRSRLSKPTGGTSGPLCHNVAVRMVWECAQAVQIPLCGVGGIETGEDAAEFILAGATAVSVGSANLYDPMSAPRILSELTEWAESQGVSDIAELVGAFEC